MNGSPEHVHVVAGVIRDARRRVLVTRRHEDAHQGGLWEFPGGKLESGEEGVAGLTRELREELDIHVGAAEPLIRVRHDYGDRRVELEVWEVGQFRGRPRGMEGQPLRWVMPDALTRLPMPEADRPVISAIRLPHLYLITPPEPGDRDDFLGRLEGALAGGISLVQLRAPGLTEAALADLASVARSACRRHGARLLLNGPWDLVRELGLDGVHLNGARLALLDERPLPASLWVGASCHDENELAQATRVGVDFVTLSPVRRTASHPETPALGWERFRELCAVAGHPVFALGGLERGDVAEARARGGQGVAGISGLWGAG